MGGRRRPGMHGPVVSRALKEVAGPTFLCAPAARDLLPARAHARRSKKGRLLPAARLHQVALAHHCRGARHHPRSGAAPLLTRVATTVCLPACWLCAYRQRRAGRTDPIGESSSRQPAAHAWRTGRLPRGRCAWKWAVIAGALALVARHDPELLSARHGVHAAARTRASSCTCHRPCPASPLLRRSGCCRQPTGSSSSSPEVDQVLGKAGRAETATDPAPLSMLETVDHRSSPLAVAARSERGIRRGRPSGSDRHPAPRHARHHLSTAELVDGLERGAEGAGAVRTPGACRSGAASTC